MNKRMLLGLFPMCCGHVLFNYTVEDNLIKANCLDCGPVCFEVKE